MSTKTRHMFPNFGTYPSNWATPHSIENPLRSIFVFVGRGCFLFFSSCESVEVRSLKWCSAHHTSFLPNLHMFCFFLCSYFGDPTEGFIRSCLTSSFEARSKGFLPQCLMSGSGVFLQKYGVFTESLLLCIVNLQFWAMIIYIKKTRFYLFSCVFLPKLSAKASRRKVFIDTTSMMKME